MQSWQHCGIHHAAVEVGINAIGVRSIPMTELTTTKRLNVPIKQGTVPQRPPMAKHNELICPELRQGHTAGDNTYEASIPGIEITWSGAE